MKRVVMLLLTALVLMLSACGSSKKISEVVAKIDDIGKVTIDSEEDIEAAESLYDGLKDNEKSKVTNYRDLRDARETFDELLEEYEDYMVFVDSAKELDDGKYFMLSSDEKSVKIGTKTSKYDTGGNALELLVAFHKALEIPDSVIDRMGSTRALDGTQTQTTGEITITWNYHPDNGLNVIYEYDYDK